MVTDQIAWPLSAGRCFPELLSDPGIRGIPGHAKVNEASRAQLDDDEQEYASEEDVIGLKEITGPDLPGMVAEEGCPGRHWGTGPTYLLDVLLDGALADSQSELEQLSPHAFCPPGAVLFGHLLDERHDFVGQGWSARPPRPRLASPHPTEQVAVPAQHSIGLYDDECLLPCRQLACQQYEQRAVAPG